MSNSELPSNGRHAGSVENDPGLCVRLLQTECIAVAASPSCTVLGACSPAATAIGLPTLASRKSAHQRGLGKSQKIRMRLGGSPNMLEDFPEKPKGMHRGTYERWCRVHDAAEERSTIGLMGFVERLGRRLSRRA